jgi:hypothetical protein
VTLAALQGLDHRKVGFSLARLPPFLVFRTSSPGRGFGQLLCLAYWFSDPDPPFTGLSVFPTLAPSAGLSSDAAPLVSLLSPSESDRTWMPPNVRQPASPGVCAPSALSASETRLPRVYQARHRPTSGFRTLLPVFVLRSLPALFHAGNALGVLLQGLFPSQSLRALSGSVTFVTFTTVGMSH